MKVTLETSITPVITVYDSSDDSPPGMISRFLSPYIRVTTDGGTVLYSWGTPKTLDLAPFAMVGLFVLAYIIVRKGVKR